MSKRNQFWSQQEVRMVNCLSVELEYVQDFTFCELFPKKCLFTVQSTFEKFTTELTHISNKLCSTLVRQRKRDGKKTKQNKKLLKKKSWRKNEKKERYMVGDSSPSEICDLNFNLYFTASSSEKERRTI